jgi:hypothetical protein
MRSQFRPVENRKQNTQNHMNENVNIACPKCGAEIPLTEAVSHRIREQLAADFERQRQEQNAALTARENKLNALQERLDQRSQSLDAAIAKQLDVERAKIAAEAARKAEEKVGTDLRDLRVQLGEQKEKLRLAQEAELELRKRKREIEETGENLKLELARQLDAERGKIAETARQQILESERLKLNEKDNKIQDLQKQIDLLQQRASQGSMQAQGETLELTLEADLHAAFPYDEIVEVKKGERGADVKQQVRTNAGLDCGAILWEAKRAKNWTASWLAKLKEDQRDAKADLAVLVTTCLPQGQRCIAQVDGVWVCEPSFACILAGALRQGLVSTALQRNQQSGRAEKMAVLYDYLCGVEFRQHIEGVVDSFKGLQDQLAAERRAFNSQWKEREQQIGKALQHTAMLYGSIQGIAGRAALPEIKSLQLPGAQETSAA